MSATNDLQHHLAGKPRLLSLDILRLFAILLVFGRHLIKFEKSDTALVLIKQGGWVGVDLFLVLSGFLVSGLLFSEYQKTQKLSIGRFYLRRGLKIYPAFYVMFVASLIHLLISNSIAPETAKPVLLPALAEVFFFQNYVKGLWSHTWSLALEEHFYIGLPLLLLLLVKIRPGADNPFKPLIFISIALMILILAGRYVTTAYIKFSYWTHFFPTHLRIDSLLFGVLISYVYHFHPRRFLLTKQLAIPLILVGLGLLVPAYLLRIETNPYLYTFGFTQFYIAGGMILTGMLHIDFSRFRIARFAAYLGSYSYSIYLWHVPVRNWGYPWLEQVLGTPMNVYLHISIYVVFAIAFGVLMSKLIEMPVLKLRDRFFPSRAEAVHT